MYFCMAKIRLSEILIIDMTSDNNLISDYHIIIFQNSISNFKLMALIFTFIIISLKLIHSSHHVLVVSSITE
jgi:hypothetical protein